MPRTAEPSAVLAAFVDGREHWFYGELDPRSRAVHVGGRHAGGVSGRPLHELDPVAVRVGQPGRPEPWSRFDGRF